ncbi:MAG TPA: hypothetical protein VHY19_08015 [Steroidobacteraceae bacterium]|jgi:hypothetical protein|nr:hypothetical protein [Steroidobacteraceae bacterium]
MVPPPGSRSSPSSTRRLRAALAAAPAWLILCLAGCNCDGNTLCKAFNSAATSSTSTAGSAAGIWTGTDSATNLELTGYIDANGQADFIRSDGVQFTGTAQVSGTTVNISLSGYTQYGYEFSDGSAFGTGTFSGTVASGSTLSGSVDFTTADDTTIDGSWSLTFDSLYDTASSLDAISGTYTDNLAAVTDGVDPLNATSLTISSDGVLYAQGSADGCVANGTVTVVSASADVYQVSYTLANCTGSDAVLNGVDFSGLAELNTDASPQALVLAVTGTSSSGAYYSIASELSGS